MGDLNIIEVITDWQQSHEYHACALQSEVVDERNALSNVVGYIGKVEEDNKRLREAVNQAFLSSNKGAYKDNLEKLLEETNQDKALSQEG